MKRIYPRTAALAAATVILLVFGIIYAWSIFSVPFSTDLGRNVSELGFCFTLIMISFCLGGIAGSKTSKKYGIKTSVLFGGTLCFLAYVFVSTVKGASMLPLYVLFCISGIGCGIVYNTVVSGVMLYFPEKRGFASGIMLMGFGASTLVFGTLASSLMLSPLGWRLTYVLFGCLLLITAFFGRSFLVSEVPERNEERVSAGLTTSQMLRTPDFWLYFIAAALLTFFGQGVIGHARNIAEEGGLALSVSTVTVGLVSVANGFGRMFFGFLHDRKGFFFPLLLDALMYIAAGVAMALSVRSASGASTAAALILCGFAYGAVPPISSSCTREFFGAAHHSENYSIVNLTILISAFGSTVLGGIKESTGSYVTALFLLAAIELAAIALLFVLRKIRKAVR